MNILAGYILKHSFKRYAPSVGNFFKWIFCFFPRILHNLALECEYAFKPKKASMENKLFYIVDIIFGLFPIFSLIFFPRLFNFDKFEYFLIVELLFFLISLIIWSISIDKTNIIQLDQECKDGEKEYLFRLTSIVRGN
jgi:hypothetical protein